MGAALIFVYLAAAAVIARRQRQRDGELDQREGALEVRRHTFELQRVGVEAVETAYREGLGVPGTVLDAYEAGYQAGLANADQHAALQVLGEDLVAAAKDVA